MLKKMIMCATVAMAALVMFSGVAEAAITATYMFETYLHANNVTEDVPNPGDWTMNSSPAGDTGRGTLEIAGGSLLDTAGYNFPPVGWGSAGTMTVTGDGSRFLSTTNILIGRNNGAGSVIVADGGWVELSGTGNTIQMNTGAPATLLVTGANSKLTGTNGKIICGNYAAHAPAIMTVEDSGLLQTKSLQFGLDGGSSGYLHMGDGGVLAVEGNKTTNPFISGGMFVTSQTGEIQYNPSGDGTTWLNMTGATEGDDYTLIFHTSSHIINGQNLDGHTVLTMIAPVAPVVPEPASIAIWSLLGVCLAGYGYRRRRRNS